MKKIALITGATSGIGEATARVLSKNDFDLILCGRRKDRLEKLLRELSSNTKVTTLCFDVSRQEKVADAIQSLPDTWKNIDVLVNNAGNAHGLSPIQTGDTHDWDKMIDINVKGLLYVSKQIMNGMIDRKSGHILNIGSIAGQEV